jgi:hypothetical protein
MSASKACRSPGGVVTTAYPLGAIAAGLAPVVPSAARRAALEAAAIHLRCLVCGAGCGPMAGPH